MATLLSKMDEMIAFMENYKIKCEIGRDININWNEWNNSMKVINIAPICYKQHNKTVISNRPCFVIDNVFTKKECESMIKSTLYLHETKPTSLLPGVRSQFSIFDPELSNIVWNRIKHLIPNTLDGGVVIGLQKNWRHARYFPGQSVFAHMDYRHGNNINECIVSRLSFTVYLNEDFEGGYTSFVKGMKNDGSFDEEYYKNKPKTGSAIVFYQCVPEFAHNATVVYNGHKSIMRADILYRFSNKTIADVGGLNIK
eukprot:205539_1